MDSRISALVAARKRVTTEHRAKDSVLHLVGCGGHATVVADVARRVGHRRLVLWCDAEPDLARFPPGSAWAALVELDPATPVLLAFGDLPERRAIRAKLVRHAAALVDPSAVIGGGVKIGPGTVVMPGCVINARAVVEEDAIVNTGAIVEHDCVVGRNAHLSPGVRLAGAATVGEDAHVGTGGIVLPGIHVGSGAVVGAGAVVVRDVPPGATVAGIPARPLRP